MRAGSLALLRLSLGVLMLLWGADKLLDVEHGLKVSKHFYFGLFGSAALLKAFGVAQLVLGAAIVLGLLRRYAYPALLAVTAMTLVGVWRSVLDPWGWMIEGGNVLFYPSLIIFAGALVLHAFLPDDVYAVDARRGVRSKQETSSHLLEPLVP